MYKREFIKVVANDIDMSQKETKIILETIMFNISEELANGSGKVCLTGFGTFKTKHRKAYTARNPKNGKSVEVDAKNGISFKAGSWLKVILNETEEDKAKAKKAIDKEVVDEDKAKADTVIKKEEVDEDVDDEDVEEDEED